jgi:small-conductance mechanosensitive channel
MRKVVTVQFTVTVDFDTDGDETIEINDEVIKKAASHGMIDACEAWIDGDGIVDNLTDATGWLVEGINIAVDNPTE